MDTRVRIVRCAALASCIVASIGFAAPPPPAAKAEVQINVCGDVADVIRALHLRADSRVREVWYFDTPDRALFARRVVFRLRQDEGTSELTLKVARQDCATLPDGLLPRGEGKCEFDWHGETVQGAVSLSTSLSASRTKALRERRASLADALGAAQIRFLRERLTLWPLPADVAPIGPATLRGYRPAKGRYVIEVWELPASAPYIEISRKSTNQDAPRVRDELMTLLARADVAACTDQASRAEDKLRALTR
jgi:hypothetical protein